MSKNSKKVITVNTGQTPDLLDKKTEVVDNDIQASKQPISEPVVPIVAPVVEKKKRVVPPRSEAQKAALAEGRKKGRETINARNAKVQAEKEEMQKKLIEQQKQLEMLNKKLFEEKIVKKAVAVKKKQIKRDAVLDEISDDETPIEQIKKIQKRVQKQPEPVQPVAQYVQQPVAQSRPKFIFV